MPQTNQQRRIGDTPERKINHSRHLSQNISESRRPRDDDKFQRHFRPHRRYASGGANSTRSGTGQHQDVRIQLPNYSLVDENKTGPRGNHEIPSIVCRVPNPPSLHATVTKRVLRIAPILIGNHQNHLDATGSPIVQCTKRGLRQSDDPECSTPSGRLILGERVEIDLCGSQSRDYTSRAKAHT